MPQRYRVAPALGGLFRVQMFLARGGTERAWTDRVLPDPQPVKIGEDRPVMGVVGTEAECRAWIEARVKQQLAEEDERERLAIETETHFKAHPPYEWPPR